MAPDQSEIDVLLAEFSKKDSNELDLVIENYEEKDESEIKEKAKEYKTNEDNSLSEGDFESERLRGERLPPKEHKVIDRLDEINKESEEKVNKLFEKLENISTEVDEVENLIEDIKPFVNKHKEFMDFFVEHFPKTSIKKNYEYFKNIVNILNEIEDKVNSIRDDTFDAMDILQFQDITRQKIERVISVIKALHDYLNNWFASDYESIPRARVAHTIVNEEEKEEIDEEVESIIKQMQRGEIK